MSGKFALMQVIDSCETTISWNYDKNIFLIPACIDRIWASLVRLSASAFCRLALVFSKFWGGRIHITSSLKAFLAQFDDVIYARSLAETAALLLRPALGPLQVFRASFRVRQLTLHFLKTTVKISPPHKRYGLKCAFCGTHAEK